MYTYTYVCMYVYATRPCMYVCMYVYIYIYIYIVSLPIYNIFQFVDVQCFLHEAQQLA